MSFVLDGANATEIKGIGARDVADQLNAGTAPHGRNDLSQAQMSIMLRLRNPAMFSSKVSSYKKTNHINA